MKKIMALLLVILMLFSLTSCTTSAVPSMDSNKDLPFVQIEDSPYLSYDKYTRIVYYLFREVTTSEYGATSYITEYYNRNGKLCQYIDGSIVEIND